MMSKLIAYGIFVLFACGPGEMASRTEASPIPTHATDVVTTW